MERRFAPNLTLRAPHVHSSGAEADNARRNYAAQMAEDDEYGDYILRTGRSVASWQDVFNSYLFNSRFRGMDRVVDLGPGRCDFTRQSPDTVVAVDNSPSIVERYSSEGLDIRLGSAYEMPFEDGSVDALYSCWLLEHLEEPQTCIRETNRILKDGAYACFVVPSAESLWRGFYDDYTHLRPFTKASCAQLATDGGFETHSASYLFWTRGLRRLIPILGKSRTEEILHQMDVRARKFGVVNKYNLLFEVWKPADSLR